MAFPMPLLPPVTTATCPWSGPSATRLLSVHWTGMHSKAHRPPSQETSPRDLWRPRPGEFTREDLADALVTAKCAGPACSHDRANVLAKVERLVRGDPDSQFGLSGLTAFTGPEVLDMMAAEAGFDPDPEIREGDVPIDPFRVLAACERAGRRLAEAAARGERVVLATGHPAGLILLYMAVAGLLEDEGARVIRPGSGRSWREMGRHREIRYFHGAAALTDRAGTLHTHGAGPMEIILNEARPDLVFADHGFAGAAVEAGIETLSIADVNDPALVVAKHQGRTDVVIVMDDNVQPESYWPCFQAMAASF
ncbi:MAG: phosphatase [Actinobacteria bacterium]|nr:MAG: phosphatase [Actinomycetota bacterium]